jgi:hypothetical protein
MFVDRSNITNYTLGDTGGTLANLALPQQRIEK